MSERKKPVRLEWTGPIKSDPDAIHIQRAGDPPPPPQPRIEAQAPESGACKVRVENRPGGRKVVVVYGFSKASEPEQEALGKALRGKLACGGTFESGTGVLVQTADIRRVADTLRAMGLRVQGA